MEKLSALGTAGGGARSYSDFMRSLAAKYNNNEYFTPTSAGSSPPQATAALKQDIFPFLGLGGAFPGLTIPGLGLPGLPPGFHPFLGGAAGQDRDKPGSNQPPALKRARDQGDPLDLTEKRVKTERRGSQEAGEPEEPGRPRSQGSPPRAGSPGEAAQPEADPALQDWTVEQVASFVMEIDICREYGQVFRDHKIDGGCLPLLTEHHLTSGLGLKLGPALRLLTALRRKLGPSAQGAGCVQCAHCHERPGGGDQDSGEA